MFRCFQTIYKESLQLAKVIKVAFMSFIRLQAHQLSNHSVTTINFNQEFKEQGVTGSADDLVSSANY
jgi:hypothetical protein